MNQIEQYLVDKGLEYRAINNQFNVKCPFCLDGKWNHCYLSDVTGVWYCQKCSGKGSFNEFRKLFNDEPINVPEQATVVQEKEFKLIEYKTVQNYAQSLWSFGDKILEYLRVKRGLQDKTIKHFMLGCDGHDITIPLIDSEQVVVNVRRRKDPFMETEGPRYYSEKGCKAILFNEQVLKYNPKSIFITEGEMDAMVLWQMGVTNVVSVTQGANYFSEHWVDLFNNVSKIYIVFDSDVPGQKGALKVAAKLGKDKCRLVELPNSENGEKCDVTNYVVDQKHTKEDFLALVDKARLPVADVDAVKHISEYNEQLLQRLLTGGYKGLSTGLAELDAIIGGYRSGRLIILSGLTSVGKTTFSVNLSLQLLSKQFPMLFISMEMPPIDIYKKFLMLRKKLMGYALDGLTETSPEMKILQEGIAEFTGENALPLYVCSKTGEIKLESILDIARVAKENYGVQVVVIDHLHYFGHVTNNRASELSDVVRKIKAIAMELDITVLLLAHLNRGGRTQQRRGMYVPSLSDLKDTSAIEQDADQVIFVCRDSEATDEDTKRKTVVKVAKNRDGKTGHFSMDFDLNTGVLSTIAGVDYLEEKKSKFNKVSDREEGTMDMPIINF